MSATVGVTVAIVKSYTDTIEVLGSTPKLTSNDAPGAQTPEPWSASPKFVYVMFPFIGLSNTSNVIACFGLVSVSPMPHADRTCCLLRSHRLRGYCSHQPKGRDRHEHDSQSFHR